MILSLIAWLVGLHGHLAHAAVPLTLHAPHSSRFKAPASAEWHLDGDVLHVDVNVNLPVLHSKSEFGPKDFPFQFDVAEVFLSVHDPAKGFYPYFEFEVTPLGQRYDVRIEGPKRFIGGLDSAAQAVASRTPKAWQARFSIPLKDLGWDGNPRHLRGGVFVIVGKPPQREYWSTVLPAAKKPNFHQPQHFKPLFP